MVTTSGVSHVPNAERIGASVVKGMTLAVLSTLQTEVSLGVRVALIMLLTGVMIVMSTMQTGAIDVQTT
jgi:hypothetical protein